jgi:hypothetical protein
MDWQSRPMRVCRRRVTRAFGSANGTCSVRIPQRGQRKRQTTHMSVTGWPAHGKSSHERIFQSRRFDVGRMQPEHTGARRPDRSRRTQARLLGVSSSKSTEATR